ncbi:luciferase family oxidoreductase, group 1 [Granulicatella balaenopterae]|uniref:Luciferase family oxidoreductase, group 1 n=1 Tax=Granulicatella balaenopterae TaxID=137733 RepID=A0A1H9GWZ7_9LACT|nr:MsnO8 family LLM class oxidoreductase [Granulicatella balaenopterae]SEQ54567.1 luciferase family oxidoreductase, group 1 [Granulicatella balaenopterae]
MKLSVLDYGVIDYGGTATTALQQTLSLAQTAEKYGYYRFLVAEHHHIAAFSTSSPEILTCYLASQTESIRIGTAGIMLMHYSPYKVAEQMKTLAALFPGRIDLGIGSAMGTLVVQRALETRHNKKEYPQLLQQLLDDLSGKGLVRTYPKIHHLPNVFVLSSSEVTAQLAAQLGLSYTFGIFPFMKKDLTLEAQKIPASYRQAFKVSEFSQKPYVIFACFIVIAETAKEAEAMAKCLDIWMLGKEDFNKFKTYPTIEQAKNYSLSKQDKNKIQEQRKRMVIGNSKEVKAKLDKYLALSQADELLVIPLVPGFENRKKAVQLLAQLYL